MELDRRLSQAINWAHRKKIDFAAGAVLSAAAFACSGGNGKSETNPTPLGPDIPPTTVVQITPTEVPPTPTPEAPKLSLVHRDVFAGKIEGGGEVIFTVLADPVDPNKGKILFLFEKSDKCSNPTYFAFRFDTVADYVGDGFNFTAHAAPKDKIVGAKLEDAQTIKGIMKQEAAKLGSPSGPVECPAGEFNFTAKKIGNGKQAFENAYLSAVAYRNGTIPSSFQNFLP